MIESAWPVLLFLAFLFVSLALILGMGITSREDERAERERAEAEGAATATPATEREPLPTPNRMTTYLAMENDGAARGVSSAPVARPPAANPATVDDLVEQLEEFLRGEAQAVAAFVAAPSVGGLLDDPARSRGRRADGRRLP